MKNELFNKIKLIDNDLTTSILLDKESFLEIESIDKNRVLSLQSFNLNKIKKFLFKYENKKGDLFILLDGNKELSKEDVENLSNLDISDFSDNKVYRVILLNHGILNENLDLLLEETIVLFLDENLNLDNL